MPPGWVPSRVKRALWLFAVLALLAPMLVTPVAQAQGNQVLLVEVDGVVTRGTALHIQDAIDEASERGVPLVLQLDTPGGLVDATLDIFRSIEQAEVPVLTYVGPRGGFAASAGTFILLMGHPSGMAPNTQIGSAQPIQQSPSGGTESAGNKTVNFLVQRIQDIADRSGRNQTIAKRFITENLNLNETAALRAGMIDVVSPDVQSFLDEVDGRSAIVGSSVVRLDTADAQIVPYEKGLMVELIEIVGNPQIAFVLFLAGLYGVIFGLANPGTYVPETIGALLLVMALIGLGLFSTSIAGILLLLLAGVFFVAEVFTPTHGILTAAGVVALVLAGIFLVTEPLLPPSFFRQFFIVAIVSALVSGAGVIGAVTLALKAQQRPVATLVGSRARVTKRLDPEGQVHVHGERWKAVAEEGPIEVDEEVVVVARDGLTLTVEPSERSEGDQAEDAAGTSEPLDT